MELKYVNGDATSPIGTGMKIIPHICNDIGAWGAGFVMALSARWRAPEKEYRMWHRMGYMVDMFGYRETFALGSIQFVCVESDIIVANMIAQTGIYSCDGVPPIRYDALAACLYKVASIAENIDASIHAPRFGAGLAGGEWTRIEMLIKASFQINNVTVYDYDAK